MTLYSRCLHRRSNRTQSTWKMVTGWWQGELVPEERDTQTIVSNRGAARAWAFHLYDEMTWDRLMVAPGFRFEWINTGLCNRLQDTSQDNFLSIVLLPGMGLHYELNFSVYWLAHTAALVLFARGAQKITPNSNNYEAGTRIARQKTEAEVIGFDDYSNLTGEALFRAVARMSSLTSINKKWFWSLTAQNRIGPEAKDPLGMNFLGKALYTLTLTPQSSFSSSNPHLAMSAGDATCCPRAPGYISVGLNGSLGVKLQSVIAMRDTAGQGELVILSG